MAAQRAPELRALRQRAGPGFVERLRAVWADGDAALPLPLDLPEAQERAIALRVAEAPPLPAGAAVVVLTSGTTGLPKGVILSHDALTAAARITTRCLHRDPGDRWLCCVPLTRIAGLGILARSDLLGTPPVILPRFDPAEVLRHEATLISLVPTMLYRLLEQTDDLSRWRAILLGGGPADPTLLQRARAAGARIVRTYGMTETCGGVVYDGRPLEGVEVRVAPDGAVSIASPTLMEGYLGDEERTRSVLADGWFRTADVGRIESDGALSVLGRRDRAIVTGAEKVAPAEVEEALRSHPAVVAASAWGEPDEEWGERVVAQAEVSEPVDEGALKTHLRSLLRPYALPKRIDVWSRG